jgi:RNA polymerase sigma factor (sigma-70 family)
MRTPPDPLLHTLLTAARTSASDNTPAMNTIIRRFDGHARGIARKLTNDHSLRDDLANAARLGLVRAVRRHDGRRIGFSSFADRYMRGAALRRLAELTRRSADATIVPLDVDQHAPRTDPIGAYEERLALWGEGEVANAVATLTDAQQRLFVMRYVLDAQLTDIAAADGTTVSAASQRLKTAHKAVALAIAA